MSSGLIALKTGVFCLWLPRYLKPVKSENGNQSTLSTLVQFAFEDTKHTDRSASFTRTASDGIAIELPAVNELGNVHRQHAKRRYQQR
jgi:hypothetical protein